MGPSETTGRIQALEAAVENQRQLIIKLTDVITNLIGATKNGDNIHKASVAGIDARLRSVEKIVLPMTGVNSNITIS